MYGCVCVCTRASYNDAVSTGKPYLDHCIMLQCFAHSHQAFKCAGTSNNVSGPLSAKLSQDHRVLSRSKCLLFIYNYLLRVKMQRRHFLKEKIQLYQSYR